jgi:hypothetical protein
MTIKKQGQTCCQKSLARAFALRAVTLCALFLVAHLLGLRRYTSVLSGTEALDYVQRLGGVVYIVFYGLFVAWVPVLLIAAVLAKAMESWSRWRGSRQMGTEEGK